MQHLTGYQHIDLSLKKRGFWSEENPYGWRIGIRHYPESELDKWEQYWILEYTRRGYQCRYNKTAGGQGEGKEKINDFRPAKGYRDGLPREEKHGKGTRTYYYHPPIHKFEAGEAKQQGISEAFEKFNELLGEGK